MRKIWTVAKNELIRYFISPLAYVYLISFLLLNGSFAIYFGHFFERGNADLSPMFAYQPWLYLLFVPGISMRLWAEEFRSKTVVQMVTMPVSITQLVWGKFLASWLFCLLALFLTFPFVITVNLLGNPDNGIIVSGYLASFVLSGCMLAISQTMSALTKNQVIALVLAVIANLIFFLSGLEYVLAFFRLFTPPAIVDMIASFSFLTHFNTMMAGLLELRDVVFFASLILLFNFTTVLAVSFRTSGSSRLLQSTSRNYYILVFVLLLSAFAGLNLLGNAFLRGIRHDFSEEKIFTVTDATAQVLKNLKYPVTAKLYYSKILEQKNPDLRQMFDKVRILLGQYAELSDGKFDYRIYHPEMLSDREDQALAAGLQPLPLIGENQNAFFGMSLTDELDNHAVIPFFAAERFDYLEQDITSEIYALGHEKKTIGILTPLDVFDTVQSNNVVTQKWAFVSQLEKFYQVKKVETTDDVDGLDALILIHPRSLSDAVVEKIKDYSEKGGRILLFADVAPEAPRIYSPSNNDLLPSDLKGLDAFWGFKFEAGKVVADLTNSLTVDITDNYRTNPSFTQDVLQFVLKRKNFNPQAPEVNRLKEILFASASAVELLPENERRVDFIPLVKASINSELMPAAVAQKSVPPEKILQNFQPDAKEKIIAAKIVSRDEKHPYQVIAVADTDILYDAFWSRTLPVLDRRYIIPLTDNINFVLNALESFWPEEINLIGLRGKSSSRRPFENIERMRRDGERSFKVKEAEIFNKIRQTKNDLQDIWDKKDFEERRNFTPDELAVIAGIRKNLESLRRELQYVRAGANAAVRALDRQVKFFNIYAVPLLLLLFLTGCFLLKQRKNKRPAEMVLNRQFLLLGGVALFLLAAGLAAAYRTGRNLTEQTEGLPVFENLSEKINNVSEIVFTGHVAVLRFYKKGSVWQLDNPAGVPVYQERIRSFLSALLEARFYEKKTSDAVYLKKFDLNPPGEEGSKNIRVELKDKTGKIVEGFEIGRYDIDIGRGAKGAYVKFDNRFQVWLVAADFIDLSPDWRNWTYSSLWNLRFGRTERINNSTDANYITMVMKYILNTPLESMAEKKDCNDEGKPAAEIVLIAEGGSRTVLSLYQCGGHFYAGYDFAETAGNEHLQFFASYARNRLYRVEAENAEKIKYVLDTETKQ